MTHSTKNKDWIKKYWIYCIVGIIIGIFLYKNEFNLITATEEGLRINNTYIKAIKPCQIEVNDVYIDNLIKFADKCGGSQKFFKHLTSKKQIIGVTLWCGNTSGSFTFFYSDKRMN